MAGAVAVASGLRPMRSRHGRSRGGRKRSQASQAAAQYTPTASPPTLQAMTPPSSPSRRPLLHHAFQNFHFKFQISLIRPVISANISIIFTKEESQNLASMCVAAESSQGGFRIVGNHGIEQQQGDDDPANRQDELQAEDKATGVALPPGGSTHGASASVVIDRSSSSTPPASNPLGGSGDGEATTGEDFWYGNACPVEEVPLDQDMVI